MQKRKTIEVETLKDRVNRRLADSDLSDEAKDALSGLLEGVLFDTGNYRGFTYLKWNHEDYIRHLDYAQNLGCAYTPIPESCDTHSRRYL